LGQDFQFVGGDAGHVACPFVSEVQVSTIRIFLRLLVQPPGQARLPEKQQSVWIKSQGPGQQFVAIDPRSAAVGPGKRTTNWFAAEEPVLTDGAIRYR
jgi:hypothetical protein